MISVLHATKPKALIVALCLRGSIALAAGVAVAPSSKPELFYTQPSIFSMAPVSDFVVPQSVNRFGPVGIGIELHPPAFVMKVKNVEAGSPAEATGKLKAGQIIETINGQSLKDIDPRIQLGRMITAAEATDGKVVFAVRDDEQAVVQTVTVVIPVLGAYSKTWPLNCPKSDKIVRGLADRLAQDELSRIDLAGSKMLFLLSTGEEKDLEVVRRWVKSIVEKNQDFGEKNLAYAWFIGWGAPPLAEYYLRTGDATVLPLMKKIADAAKRIQYHDGWGGRGLPGHHMGLAGTSTLTFLLLARQCGVDVDEDMLQSALRHYYRFAGRGTNPYMDDYPEQTFTDNGRNGMLTFAMAAAAALTPDRENSLYAKARDIAAMSSFYSGTYMNHGHTDGGIGEVWRTAAMGVVADKRPAQVRDFLDQRAWWVDLSRRYDGSLGALGGGSYDAKHVDWVGPTMGLTYTAPRKQLCIFGAPRSKFAHDHKIPDRPWGTPADDAFLALDGAVEKDGAARNLDHERMATDSGVAFHRRLPALASSEEDIIQFLHHPQYFYRSAAAGLLYTNKRWNLIPELLRHKDARVRYAGLQVMKMPAVSSRPERCDPGFPVEAMNGEILDLLFGMVNDPEESWLVVDQALKILSRRSADELAPHADQLARFLGHEEQWIRHSALNTMIPLVKDPRTYQAALQAMEREVPNFIRSPRALVNLAKAVIFADPEIQGAVRETLGRIYLAYPGKNANPPGGLHPLSGAWYLDTVAEALGSVPGGLDKLYEVSQQRNPGNRLSHQPLFLTGDAIESSPKAKESLPAVIMEELIPVHVARNHEALRKLAAAKSTGRPGGRSDAMDQLAELHKRAGNDAYAWRSYGTDRLSNEWTYFTFDPPETQLWEDERAGRYRQVTYPTGMETWFAKDFDITKAGWRKGQAPFANIDGHLPPPRQDACINPVCGCGDEAKTLWDKEILLMRRTFELPPLKEGYRYRLLVGGRSHVGAGDGYCVYINGRKITETVGYGGRGSGGEPNGAFITPDFFDEFKDGKVVVAATSFLRKDHRSHKIQGNINIWFEEMKIPPIGDDLVQKAAGLIPMTSSAWQLLQDPESEIEPDEGKFLYDGKFTPNPALIGSWTQVDQVAEIEAFKPGTQTSKTMGRPIYELAFMENGTTINPLLRWSGDILMDLNKHQALKVTIKTIDGTEYLFVEAGGFDQALGPDWISPILVMKRR